MYVTIRHKACKARKGCFLGFVFLFKGFELPVSGIGPQFDYETCHNYLAIVALRLSTSNGATLIVSYLAIVALRLSTYKWSNSHCLLPSNCCLTS